MYWRSAPLQTVAFVSRLGISHNWQFRPSNQTPLLSWVKSYKCACPRTGHQHGAHISTQRTRSWTRQKSETCEPELCSATLLPWIFLGDERMLLLPIRSISCGRGPTMSSLKAMQVPKGTPLSIAIGTWIHAASMLPLPRYLEINSRGNKFKNTGRRTSKAEKLVGSIVSGKTPKANAKSWNSFLFCTMSNKWRPRAISSKL